VATPLDGPHANDLARQLRDAGLHLAPGDVAWEERDERWLGRLPDDRLIWAPANPHGAERLARERRVLRLLAERCTFKVPRILFESAAGWDLRAMVPGGGDVWALYRRVLADDGLAAAIGQAIGTLLAEQHTRIRETDVSGWLPTGPDWPEASETLRRQLPLVVDDAGLLRALHEVLARYDAIAVSTAERALVHGDLGLHNLAMTEGTATVAGVFDYDGACWADRHHDFRYLVFDADTDVMLEAALASYQPATGISLSRGRIRLYNAAAAIGFLAARGQAGPDDRPAGRTLAQDLAWVKSAISRL
jgi:aminoglycoside phosphotransferase (APT) family kinase protein